MQSLVKHRMTTYMETESLYKRTAKTTWQQQQVEAGFKYRDTSGTNQGNHSDGKTSAREETKLISNDKKKSADPNTEQDSF